MSGSAGSAVRLRDRLLELLAAPELQHHAAPGAPPSTGTVVTRCMRSRGLRALHRVVGVLVDARAPVEVDRRHVVLDAVLPLEPGLRGVVRDHVGEEVVDLDFDRVDLLGRVGSRRTICCMASMLQCAAPQQACRRIVDPRVAMSHEPSPSRIFSGSPCSRPSRRATPSSPSRISSLAVNPIATSSAPMTPCIAAAPGGEPLGVGPAVLHHPGHGRRRVAERHARLRGRRDAAAWPPSAPTPSVSWKPWLNQPRLISSLPRGPITGFIVWAVISQPTNQARTTSRPDAPSFSPSASEPRSAGCWGGC